jgi:hypothetical protein
MDPLFFHAFTVVPSSVSVGVSAASNQILQSGIVRGSTSHVVSAVAELRSNDIVV